MIRGSRRGFVTGFLAGLAVALAVAAAFGGADEILDGETDLSEEALETIERSYFRDPSPASLEDSSVRGMVRTLRQRFDDRFSHYFDPDDFEQFQSSSSGEFEGIGLTVSEVGRGLRVASVFEDTPAEDAEIEVGEVITKVDGRSIAGVPSDVSTARIQGEPGTTVRLEVLDPERDRSRELTVERRRIRIPAVEGRMLRDGGEKVGYARLATFSKGAHGELRDQIEDLERRGAEGLVLDLRGNGGGLLNEAVLVASIFVPEGPIVITRGRTQPRRVFRASGDALEERPTTVLVNGDTASAAEIVTAALKENDLATVVGTRTFGKGTFQEVIEIGDGAALDLTVGEFVTADGVSLAGNGIKPDVRVAAEPGDGRDRAVRRALRVLRPEIP